MKNSINVSVFGVHKDDLEQFKSKISACLSVDFTIVWVSIAEQRIDYLFVSDYFIYSTAIQNALNSRVAKFLKVIHFDTYQDEIINNELYYPINNLSCLKEWFSVNKVQNLNQVSSQVESKPTFRQPDVKPNLSFNKNASLEKVFEEIFTPRNGYIQLFEQNNYIALIDTRTERVWVNGDVKIINFNNHLNQSYATGQTVNNKMESHLVYDLRSWLWSSIDHSAEPVLPKIDINQNFKLDIWPQFKNDIYRRDFIRMATCFSEGASLKDVQAYLNLTEDKVIRFVQYANLLQLGTFIHLDQVKFFKERNSTKTDDKSKLRSFFGRLRKKLGL